MPSAHYTFKAAFSIPRPITFGLGGAVIGGMGGGFLGWHSGKDIEDPEMRADKIKSGIIGGAITGGSLGTLWGASADQGAHEWNNKRTRSRQEAEDWAEDIFNKYKAARNGHVEAWRQPLHNLYNEDRMGTPLKKVWTAVADSAELTDPAKRKAVEAFMKNVGTLGADTSILRQHMETLKGTKAFELMNVLFNKFHGTKVAMKIASRVETCLAFGLMDPFYEAVWE